jgi:hypothetical protein
VVLECQKEKKAARVIESFFLKIKEEIDVEIRRRQRKKRDKRRRMKKEAGEGPLEKVWLNSVDDGSRVDVFAFSPGPDTLASKSTATPRIHKTPSTSSTKNGGERRRSIGHRASSPPMNLVLRHDYETQQTSRQLSSGQTRSSSRGKREASSAWDHEENLSLKESYIDAEVKEKASEKYSKKYGIKIVPTRTSRRFFGEDLEPTMSPAGGGDQNRRRKSVPRIQVGSDSLSRSRSSSERPVTSRSPRMSEASPVTRPSPRHGKILVMNPFPDYHPSKKDTFIDVGDVEYVGEEFGMI